jgi:hypothetical protein
MNSPKILLYDLEVSRSIVEGYGNKWDYKVVKMTRPQMLMCFSYKWLGEKKIHHVTMHDFKTSKELAQSLADVLDQCDVAIAHNLKRFDDKMSYRYFIKDDVAPPSPYKQIDTLIVARSTFKFESNSLKDLGDYLDLGTKEKITYADLEDDFMGKPSAKTLRLMKKYNNKDVELLEAIYLKMRPYMKQHPNLALISDKDGCPKCGSKNRQYRGTAYANTVKYKRVFCNDCRSWARERVADKEIQNRPDFVN